MLMPDEIETIREKYQKKRREQEQTPEWQTATDLEKFEMGMISVAEEVRERCPHVDFGQLKVAATAPKQVIEEHNKQRAIQ